MKKKKKSLVHYRLSPKMSFFGLHLNQCLFAPTDNLLKSLQSKHISVTARQDLARLTVNRFRNDESFNSFYVVIPAKVKEHPSVSEPMHPRKRHAPSHYEVGTSEPEYPTTTCDYYNLLLRTIL